jgi:hypothetical protein
VKTLALPPRSPNPNADAETLGKNSPGWSCLAWWRSLCTGRRLSAASIKSTPETMTVTFEEFSPPRDFCDYKETWL